jgi:hypothetical protein
VAKSKPRTVDREAYLLQKVPDVIWQVFPFVEEGGWSL